jgi:threonine/homoserine/homoserine lactone efflux protein
MITLKMLVLFLVTILPLVCTPGPDILFVSSQGLAARRKGAFLATVGICAGYLIHALLATAGLAAVIAASPLLFAIIKWIGAAYLLYLGFRLLASALSRRETQPPRPSPASGLLRRGMFTSLLNPKGLLFFLALLPQFVDPAKGHAALQTLIFALAFVGACFVVYLAIGLVVATARERFAGNGAGRTANGVAGTILIGLGLRLAFVR